MKNDNENDNETKAFYPDGSFGYRFRLNNFSLFSFSFIFATSLQLNGCTNYHLTIKLAI